MELVAKGNPCYGRKELTNSVILVVVVVLAIIIIIQRKLPITAEQSDSRLRIEFGTSRIRSVTVITYLVITLIVSGLVKHFYPA